MYCNPIFITGKEVPQRDRNRAILEDIFELKRDLEELKKTNTNK